MALETYINAVCRISDHTIIKNGETVFSNPNDDLSAFLISSYKHLNINYPKFYKMDNLSKLGFLASEVLLQHSFKAEEYLPQDIGIVLANANASLDTDIKYFETVKDIPGPSLFVYTLPNIVIGEISIRNNFKGENAFFVFERFDTNFIETYIRNLLDSDVLNACICGWVEVLENEHKAVLFLIETNMTNGSIFFTKENINKYIANG